MKTKGCYFSDQEDVLSEIIFKILVEDDNKVLRAYQGKSQLSTYLWPIVRFKIIDTIRREKSTHTRLVFKDELDENVSDHSNPGGQVETIIEEFIENEPPLEKFIKYARWMHELSYDEIIIKAKTVFKGEKRVNFSFVNNTLHANRKALQNKLKKNGY